MLRNVCKYLMCKSSAMKLSTDLLVQTCYFFCNHLESSISVSHLFCLCVFRTILLPGLSHLADVRGSELRPGILTMSCDGFKFH